MDSEVSATRKKGPAIRADSSICKGCLTCELRCSLRFEKAFNPDRAAIRVRRGSGRDSEYQISFSERCDNCGICVRYCSYGALSQEAREANA